MINLNLSENEEKELKDLAKSKGISVEDLIKGLIFQRLEDREDRRIADESLKEYRQNPVVYTIDEVFNI